MNKTRKIRSVVAVVLAFLMSLCIVCAFVCGAARLTALNPSYAKSIIKKCNFGENKVEELKIELVSYGNACNIGDDFFDDFFATTLTPEFIEEDTLTYYSDVYSESKPVVDSSRLEQLLKPALVKYAEDKGYANEASLDDDLNLIVGEMGQIYSGVLALPSVSTIHALIFRVTRICEYALIGCGAGLLFCAVMLLFMFKPKVYSVRYLIYSFAGAFLMLLTVPLYVRIENLIGKVNIVSKSIYSFTVAFVNGALDSVIIAAGVCALITVALAITYVILARQEDED